MYYYCNETDDVVSTDDMRKIYESERASGNSFMMDSFESFMECCMWYNNGELTPLADHVTALRKRLNSLERLALASGYPAEYDDDVTALRDEIRHYETILKGQ